LRLTWDDLLIQDITPDQFRDWLSPWTGVVTGRVAPAFMSKFGSWFLRRPEGYVEMLDVRIPPCQPFGDRIDHHARLAGARPNQIDASRRVGEIEMSRQRARIDQAGKISEVDAGACDDGIEALLVHLPGKTPDLYEFGN